MYLKLLLSIYPLCKRKQICIAGEQRVFSLGWGRREENLKSSVSLQPLVGTNPQGFMTVSYMGKQLKLELPCCGAVPVSWLESWAEAVPACFMVFPICGRCGACRLQR